MLGIGYREKDAYDIFTVVNQCLESPVHVAKKISPLLQEDADLKQGIGMIRHRFRDIRSEGPAWVANFLAPGDQRAKERVMAEVHVNMNRFLGNLEEPPRTNPPEQ